MVGMRIMHPMSDLLTPAEAAAIYGVTTNTLRRWALDGKIEAVTLPSGQLRYPAEQFRPADSEAVAS